jgi:hypothetical protein
LVCFPTCPAASLPASLGTLAHLRALSLRGNHLAALPPALGGCSQLVELDVRDNQLAALPEELSQLTNLKLLLVDNNRLRGLPPALLTGCAALATLSLHGNPLTAEQLRETPGWAQFDERRRAKYDKQVGLGWGAWWTSWLLEGSSPCVNPARRQVAACCWRQCQPVPACRRWPCHLLRHFPVAGGHASAEHRI